MNNEQFRRLVASTPAQQDGGSSSFPPNATPGRFFGAKAKASVLMTPRQIRGGSGVDFRRQLAERNATDKPTKKFKSSAPKGVKLAAGFTDRAKERADEEEDDRAKRIKALEEAMKLEQIDRETFEKLRDEIAGGDISSTHLVKGLDRKLLERVRRGEDVYNTAAKKESDEPPPDIDEEFEKLEEKELAPVAREKTTKKGEMAAPPVPAQVAGVKRSRDEILAEWRAKRKAEKEAKSAELHLGSKFRKIGEKRDSSRIEIDERGREVLIVVDEEGNVKRKVRKTKAEEPSSSEGAASSLQNKDILGADVIVPKAPTPPPIEEEEDDDDIFEGVGTDYNPLGDLGDDDSSGSDEEGEKGPIRQREPSSSPQQPRSESEPSLEPSDEEHQQGQNEETKAVPSTAPRNYFNDTQSTASEAPTKFNPLSDPTILAALRKSRDVAIAEKNKIDPEEEARRKKREAMLASASRDFDDLDMGFGESRFEDADELEEGERVKLAEWKGTGADGEDGGHVGRSGQKRKRGPKKRKGDKNSVSDVMKVLERRKGE